MRAQNTNLNGTGIVTPDGHVLVGVQPIGDEWDMALRWPAGHGQVVIYQETSTDLNQDIRTGEVYIGSCEF